MLPGESFALDAAAAEPLYLQLAGQIERRVAGGSLIQGERLPAVRRLARTLDVSPLTVSRAYAQAQQHGALVARPGRGMYVAGTSLNMAARLELLEPALHQLAAEVKQAALPAIGVLAALRKQLEKGNPS